MYLNKLCTFVYSIECSGYVAYTTCQSNVLSFTQNYHLELQRELASFMSSNDELTISESKSNPHNNRKIHFTLHLNLTLSHIKLTFAIDPPWDGRHQPGTSLLW